MVEMQGKKGYCRDEEQNAVQTILAQTAATFSGGGAITVMSELLSGNSGNQNQHTKIITHKHNAAGVKTESIVPTNQPTNQSEATME